METVRCACYTRKSSDDATLDRDFNSLTSQREACENYINSQREKGWICLPEHYDDGGFSGGNMNRPAMTRLKEDIAAGKIDMVVCYKIDRLSRSILDFAELQSFFEKHNIHFVSVTQNIDTSSSSGRMLLNVLVTFAAFERDLIIDRTRAAVIGGKKRGKFCGGVPMMGYNSDPITKKLYIVDEEAKVVRLIFEKYMALGSLKQTVTEINALGFRTREWTSVSTGKLHKAKKWDTGTVYRILSNPVYAGYTKHYDVNYEGEHEAIIPRDQWEKVQQMMSLNAGERTQYRKQVHPLSGIVKCGHCDCALTPTYTKNHGKKYCYYICQKTNKSPDHQCELKRIPAGDLEHSILTLIAGFFHTPSVIKATLKAVKEKEQLLRENYTNDCDRLQKHLTELKKNALQNDTDFDEIRKVGELLAEAKKKKAQLREPLSETEIIAALGDVSGLWEFMFPSARQELVHLLIGEIRVFADKISLTLKVDGLKDLASEMAVSGYFYEPHGEPEKFPEAAQEVLDDGSIRMTMQLESKKIDGHRRVVIPAPGADRMRQQSLLRAIRNGQRWMEMLINGEAKNITDLAAKLGLKPPYVTRVLGLNNLAPDIVEAIVAGTEPDGLSIAQIMKNIPEDWNEQRRLYGFPER